MPNRRCANCGCALVFDDVGEHCTDCVRLMRATPVTYLESTLATVIGMLEHGQPEAALVTARRAYDALRAGV